jgi:hypothetical protein
VADANQRMEANHGASAEGMRDRGGEICNEGRDAEKNCSANSRGIVLLSIQHTDIRNPFRVAHKAIQKGHVRLIQVYTLKQQTCCSCYLEAAGVLLLLP